MPGMPSFGLRTSSELRARSRVGLVAIASVLAAVASGCVLPDQISQVRRDLDDVKNELRRVQQEQASSTDRIAGLEAAIQGGDEAITRAEFADLKLRIEEQTSTVAILGEQFQDVGARIERLSGSVAEVRELTRRAAYPPASRAATNPDGGLSGGTNGDSTDDGGATAVVGDVVPDAADLFNRAYADFSKGNYTMAVDGFEEYASRYPQSEQADNALYWVGECFYSQGLFDRAVEAFDRLLGQYPGSERKPSADLKKGLAYLEDNRIAQAIVQLRHVVDAYPSTDESRIARDKLTSLGASVR